MENQLLIWENILQFQSDGSLLNKYLENKIQFKSVEKGFFYSSNLNEKFLNVEDIRNLI